MAFSGVPLDVGADERQVDFLLFVALVDALLLLGELHVVQFVSPHRLSLGRVAVAPRRWVVERRRKNRAVSAQRASSGAKPRAS